MVQILLSAGADPTAQDAQHGRTALHTAAMANDVELVKVCNTASVINDLYLAIFNWLYVHCACVITHQLGHFHFRILMFYIKCHFFMIVYRLFYMPELM